MFWWFERGGQYLRYESREQAGAAVRYELRVTGPDGLERVETFENSTDLSNRQVQLERELAEQGWSGPHGWNL